MCFSGEQELYGSLWVVYYFLQSFQVSENQVSARVSSESATETND